MTDSTDNSTPQCRSLSEAEREALFKRLHLAHMRRIYQQEPVATESKVRNDLEGSILPIRFSCHDSPCRDFEVQRSSVQ